jgi:AGZA family xanthine/uracil permease-like MFS transporter
MFGCGQNVALPTDRPEYQFDPSRPDMSTPFSNHGKIARFFDFAGLGTNLRTEITAGLTTFVTMAYIIFVNPSILSTTGMDRDAIFVATCLAAALGSMIMGLWARWPIGMAPGMGLNAFFAFTVVGTLGYTWQEALGAVFISGVIFLVLTLTGVRKWLVAGIPHSMRASITAGIGLFLAIIALQNSGIVVDHPATLVAIGDLTQTGPLLAIFGFFLVGALEVLRVRGSILIAVLVVTILSAFVGHSEITGVVSVPPSPTATFMQLDIVGALSLGIVQVILVLVLVELFDATGTLIGVANRAGLLGDGPMQKNRAFGRSLMADSVAIISGSVIGTSSTTAYAESVAGVQAGGRSGLVAVIVGFMFLLALFFSPLAAAVPAVATAPALLFVATLMMREMASFNWDDVTEAAPAALTAIMMPLTYSIANGLAFGFITYVVLKALTGRGRQVHTATWIVAGLFVIRFWLLNH